MTKILVIKEETDHCCLFLIRIFVRQDSEHAKSIVTKFDPTW